MGKLIISQWERTEFELEIIVVNGACSQQGQHHTLPYIWGQGCCKIYSIKIKMTALEVLKFMYHLGKGRQWEYSNAPLPHPPNPPKSTWCEESGLRRVIQEIIKI